MTKQKTAKGAIFFVSGLVFWFTAIIVRSEAEEVSSLQEEQFTVVRKRQKRGNKPTRSMVEQGCEDSLGLIKNDRDLRRAVENLDEELLNALCDFTQGGSGSFLTATSKTDLDECLDKIKILKDEVDLLCKKIVDITNSIKKYI